MKISDLAFGLTDWSQVERTELADGRKFVLKSGISYQVADNAEPHRSSTRSGAKLFILD